jgi:hypothetical protein
MVTVRNARGGLYPFDEVCLLRRRTQRCVEQVEGYHVKEGCRLLMGHQPRSTIAGRDPALDSAAGIAKLLFLRQDVGKVANRRECACIDPTGIHRHPALRGIDLRLSKRIAAIVVDSVNRSDQRRLANHLALAVCHDRERVLPGPDVGRLKRRRTGPDRDGLRDRAPGTGE